MAKAEYIERSGLLAAFAEVMQYPWTDAGDLYEIVKNGPAEDAAPVVHSRWEWFEEWNPSTPDHPEECEDCGWRCGKCKAALEDMVGGYWDNPEERPKLKYCPECGAKMYLEG